MQSEAVVVRYVCTGHDRIEQDAAWQARLHHWPSGFDVSAWARLASGLTNTLQQSSFCDTAALARSLNGALGNPIGRREMEMRRAFFYATLSTLSLVAGAKAATRGSTLVFGRAIESQYLDPVHTVQNADIWLSLNLYDTLLLPAEDGKGGTEPGLATGYKGS